MNTTNSGFGGTSSTMAKVPERNVPAASAGGTAGRRPPSTGAGAVVAAILIGWAALAGAFALSVALVPGISVDWAPLTYLGLAVLWGVVNAVLRPLLRWLTLPLLIMTLGLFSIVINAALLAVVAWLSPALSIDGFWPAIAAVLVLSVANVLCSWLLDRFVERRTH